MKDLYEILGLKKTATMEQIKKAYKKKAFKVHPDKNPGKDTTAMFQEIQQAYNILSDPSLRAKYDATGSTDTRSVEAIFTQTVNYHVSHFANLDKSPPDSVNIIDDIRNVTQTEITTLKQQLTDYKTKKKSSEKMKGRIIYKGDSKNLFVEALDNHIRDFEMKIAKTEAFIKERKDFMDFLDDYDYEIYIQTHGIQLF